MNTEKIKRALILCAFLCTPFVSHAANEAVAVTDNTALFTIDFDFVTASEPYRIPIGATNAETAADYVHYTINPDVLLSNAVVLSNQPVNGTFYEIPADSRATFTLVILATVPEDMTNTEYATRLTNLPYYRGAERRTVSADRLDRFESSEVLLNRTSEGSVFRLIEK